MFNPNGFERGKSYQVDILHEVKDVDQNRQLVTIYRTENLTDGVLATILPIVDFLWKTHDTYNHLGVDVASELRLRDGELMKQFSTLGCFDREPRDLIVSVEKIYSEKISPDLSK